MTTDLARRSLLIGIGLSLLVPRPVRAQRSLDRQHRPQLDLPILAEDPTAVPIHAWVDHPMEPDHYIKSIEIRMDKDPVAYKGKFLFTPANGRASVAFQMRSGVGGVVTAEADCSKHGRFVGTKEVRVTEGGCTTAPDQSGRNRLGNPMLRLPRSIRVGRIVEVRTKVDHNSYTGLALKNGRFIRQVPAFYIKQMLVYLDEQKVSEFQMTSAVSPDPLIRFPLKATRSGRLRVVFINNEGLRWEVAEQLRPRG
ncbi:MAG: thiosulfate oxidation carrier protein SoxY [Candidatus Methylomirabilia bacterium]